MWVRLLIGIGALCKALVLVAPIPAMGDSFPLRQGEDVVGSLRAVTAWHEDTLLDVARRYGLGYEEMLLVNRRVDAWLPGEGTPILLPTQFVLPDAPRQGIVLNLAEMRMYYYPKPKRGEPAQVIVHPISIGREGWGTPLGRTQIVAKVVDPAWYPPASIRAEHAANGDPLPEVVPAGPDNPLGRFALRLGFSGYLIHGTNKPYGLGMRVSHGCIRMYPEDIEELFAMVPKGTPVQIVNQPQKAGWKDGVLYLESHPPLDEDVSAVAANSTTLVQAVMAATRGKDVSVDWDKTQVVAEQSLGIPVPISPQTPNAEDLMAATLARAQPQERQAVVADLLPERASEQQQWWIEVGPFRLRETAERIAANLGQASPPITAQAQLREGGYQVGAGPFSAQDEAERMARMLNAYLNLDARVVLRSDDAAPERGITGAVEALIY